MNRHPFLAHVLLQYVVHRSSPPHKAITRNSVFDVERFLDSAGLGRKIEKFGNKDPIFKQGDPARNVLYIQVGGVKLTVVNEAGKEAVVAILGPSDFFGEGCLAGQPVCMATATAIAPTAVLVIKKKRNVTRTSRGV